jgi:hypothetical protein
MRRSSKDQRLENLEFEFRPRLIACLRECAAGRWGLFGQKTTRDSAKNIAWPEAEELKRMAEEIKALTSEFGQLNPLAEKLFEYCSMRGSNIKGEPKLARQFLTELGET